MGYKVFCLVVFVIQTIIPCVDFKLACKHHTLCEGDAMTADIISGIYWDMTAG